MTKERRNSLKTSYGKKQGNKGKDTSKYKRK